MPVCGRRSSARHGIRGETWGTARVRARKPRLIEALTSRPAAVPAQTLVSAPRAGWRAFVVLLRVVPPNTHIPSRAAPLARPLRRRGAARAVPTQRLAPAGPCRCCRDAAARVLVSTLVSRFPGSRRGEEHARTFAASDALQPCVWRRAGRIRRARRARQRACRMCDVPKCPECPPGCMCRAMPARAPGRQTQRRSCARSAPAHLQRKKTDEARRRRVKTSLPPPPVHHRHDLLQ
jgi:hypothetical protein